VFLAVGIANAIVVIDDLVQCAKPGTVSIEDGILRVDLPRWFGRVRRERPVSDVKDVLVAKGSASVHAWGDILIRFHNARSVGMLDCASVDEARQVAEVIRVACGLGGPYVMPPGVGGPPAAMPWPPGGAPLPMPPLPAEALAGRDGA
jgi:hypothetical protein